MCIRDRLSEPYGMWRSLVAHLTGGQGVAGSNPVIPTVLVRVRGPFRFGDATLELFGRSSPGPGDHRRCDDLPTGTVRPAGEDLRMSVEKGASRAHRARRALIDDHAEMLSGRTHGACREIIAPPVIPRPRRAAAEQLEGRTAEAERPSDAHQHCRDDRI